MFFSKTNKQIEILIYFYNIWKDNNGFPILSTNIPDYEYYLDEKKRNKYISIFDKKNDENPILTRNNLENIKNKSEINFSSFENFITSQKFKNFKNEKHKYILFKKRNSIFNQINLKESKYLKNFSFDEFKNLPSIISEISEMGVSLLDYNKSVKTKQFLIIFDRNKSYSHYNMMQRFYGEEINPRQIEKYEVSKNTDQERYNKYLNKIKDLENKFNNDKESDLSTFKQLIDKYSQKDPEAIANYLKLIIKNITFPKFSKPTNFNFEYDKDNKILLFSCNLPTEEKFKVKKFKEKKLKKYPFEEIIELQENKTENKKLYENHLYLIPIKLIYEFSRFDTNKLFNFIAFNGNIKTHNKATGILEENTIMSLYVEKEKILKLNLKHIDPKECFKSLKGISANKLNELVPIKPVLNFKKDKRVVQSKEVIDNLKDQNLASMNWEDFEHLIRELFAKEFSSEGTEVKITQASRDKGVDALVFDPDPIRGGKFVIQAKRYTANVDVAAVRDLYGTILNEGANRGILVTTAKYGSDSYDFAKDKPITLLEGNELLGLLQKHGYHFKIDINEARKFLNLTTKNNY